MVVTQSLSWAIAPGTHFLPLSARNLLPPRATLLDCASRITRSGCLSMSSMVHAALAMRNPPACPAGSGRAMRSTDRRMRLVHRHDCPLSEFDLLKSLEVFDLAAVVVDRGDRTHEFLLFGKDIPLMKRPSSWGFAKLRIPPHRVARRAGWALAPPRARLAKP